MGAPPYTECLAYQCGSPGPVERKILCGEYGMGDARDPCGDPVCLPFLAGWLSYAGPYGCGGAPLSPQVYAASPASGYSSDWQAGILGSAGIMPNIGGCGCSGGGGSSSNTTGGGSVPSGPAIAGPLGSATGPVAPDGTLFSIEASAGISPIWWLILLLIVLLFYKHKRKS